MTPFIKKCLKVVGVALLVFAFIGPCGKSRSSIQRDENLPKLDVNRSVEEILTPHMTPIVQLYRKGVFHCTAFVIGNNYAVTASHCLIDDDGDKTDEEIEIRLNNKSTGIKAKAVGVDTRRDLGLIKGDFRKFDMIEIENEHPGWNVNEILLTCGYAGGNKNWTCTTFSPQTNDAFFIKGNGILIPGMSGGPVINMMTNHAMGVNCHAYTIEQGGGQGISLLYGILGLFEIEP